MNSLRRIFLLVLLLLPLRPVLASALEGMITTEANSVMTMNSPHCQTKSDLKSADAAAHSAHPSCAQHCLAPLVLPAAAPRAMLVKQVWTEGTLPFPPGISRPPLLRPPLLV